MGVGGIFLAFGATILVISIFTRMSSQWRGEIPAMMAVGLGSLIVGGVMFVVGWLLHRGVRRSDQKATA